MYRAHRPGLGRPSTLHMSGAGDVLPGATLRYGTERNGTRSAASNGGSSVVGLPVVGAVNPGPIPVDSARRTRPVPVEAWMDTGNPLIRHNPYCILSCVWFRFVL